MCVDAVFLWGGGGGAGGLFFVVVPFLISMCTYNTFLLTSENILDLQTKNNRNKNIPNYGTNTNLPDDHNDNVHTIAFFNDAHMHRPIHKCVQLLG